MRSFGGISASIILALHLFACLPHYPHYHRLRCAAHCLSPFAWLAAGCCIGRLLIGLSLHRQLRLGDTVRALANAEAVLVDSVAAADGTETPAPPLTHPQSARQATLIELMSRGAKYKGRGGRREGE